jgi:hypothetical protein
MPKHKTMSDTLRLRLDMADKLAERYGLELRPATKQKGR